MNVMCKNIRQQLKELTQYISYLERENEKLRNKINKMRNGKSKVIQ